MCQICNLLNESWPGPKSLVKSIYEVSPPGKHIEEIIEKVSEKMNQDELNEFASELMLEALRQS